MKDLHKVIIMGLALLASAVAGLVLGEEAAANMSFSPEFGYGGRIDPWGIQADFAVDVAAGMNLDWVAVDFDWAGLWPTQNVAPDLYYLNRLLHLTAKENLAVMISIRNAPAWAMTPHGPDPAITAGLVTYLVGLYPELQAVELFPGANTTEGWGARPDPGPYGHLFLQTSQALQEKDLHVTLVAAGLTPLSHELTNGDMADLEFLQKLYEGGVMAQMNVISVRLPETTGDAMTSPTREENRVLRHYEEVRNVMLRNNHTDGIIWITGFSWPSGTINPADSRYTSINSQIEWLQESFTLMSSQLYIGVAFFDRLNAPSGASLHDMNGVLIQPDQRLHPVIAAVSRLIAYRSGSGNSSPEYHIHHPKKIQSVGKLQLKNN